jgi:hypothetical protein
MKTEAAAPITLVASSVARRLASARTHAIIASRVARSVGSAAAKRLITGSGEHKPDLIDMIASQIAGRLAGRRPAGDLPTNTESAATAAE